MFAKQIRHSLLLLLTAVIWGVAFVAQSKGMDYVGPLTFNAVRSIIGGIVLIPCIFFMNRVHPRQKQIQPASKKILILGGICCGIALCLASTLQQIAIQYTTVGKAGFLTAFYIVIVPLLGLLTGKKCSSFIWISVILALCGLYLLCMKDTFSLQPGDWLLLLAAFLFSVHIMIIDYFAPRTDGVKMSCIQFFVCGVLCATAMFLFEKPSFSAILSGWLPILYAGVLSCGVAYTLQIVGQKGMNPTVASLILSLESVISVLAGWLLLKQSLSVREILGCVFVFAAIVLAQLPGKKEVLTTVSGKE